MAAPLAPALAEPADIEAAARGVVRVVILEGTDSYPDDAPRPISHGTGFAVNPTQIVTNAHVVMQAQADPELHRHRAGRRGGKHLCRLVQFSPRADSP